MANIKNPVFSQVTTINNFLIPYDIKYDENINIILKSMTLFLTSGLATESILLCPNMIVSYPI